VTPLREAVDAGAFGGKATSLGAALRAGLPVPDGFALSAAWVDRAVGGDSAALAEIQAALPALRQHVAVRSSAIGEDSADASFAGQHATILHVEPSVAAIARAVREVWASGRTESALAYRQRMGINGQPRVAIVVQRMVDSSTAGVLFSRDPVSGDDVRIIEAAWGLGEAVVAGLVTPDHFRVSRDGVILERRVGHKDLLIRRAAGGGTEEVAVDSTRAQTLSLDDARLLALHRLAERCESVYGGAQDLEWAYADMELFLLQRRPITTAR
jgi:pyruvate,water dikinase